jgi:E3 ubiquitin-protein ligase RFWD2
MAGPGRRRKPVSSPSCEPTSRARRAQVIAQLPRASARQSAAILSSIEFDREGGVFATAGVSKRISLFEYAAVLAHPTAEQHFPASELITRSKLSCLSWNRCRPC